MRIYPVLLMIGCLLPLAAVAADAAPPANLDELFKQIQQSARSSAQVNREREQRFLGDRDEARRMLQATQKELKQAKQRTAELKKSFSANQKQIRTLQDDLHDRTGELGELFGVVRQMAGQTASQLEQSIISTQFPGRSEALRELARKKALPEIPELEQFWLTMLQEMSESSKAVRFQTETLAANGETKTEDVVRVGAFNVITEGEYLGYLSENKQLVHLERQPPSRYLDQVADYWNGSQTYSELPIDPSRGAILGILVQAPDWLERIQQGKLVGYFIIALGIAGLILALMRYATLMRSEQQILRQIEDKTASPDNPLGRVMGVYRDSLQNNLDTLERKLDEAILKEAPRLDRGVAVIKILAVIAPLLGLLGTVTGMIETFQSITLFGTGD